ncbi:MAG: hypothetical protein AAGN66_17945 [Acidobacteriota bacterium]
MTEEHAESTSNLDSDDLVNARWDVAVIPNENVSIHYVVEPKNAEDAVTSVTASLVLEDSGMVTHTYAGATTSELIAPKAGQGATGDVGVDSTVFPSDVEGQLTAVLAGTVRHGEDWHNFFFKRPFDPKI